VEHNEILTKEIDIMNDELDLDEAISIVEDMHAWTDILDTSQLSADDLIGVDGDLTLKELEALVVVFKSKLVS